MRLLWVAANKPGSMVIRWGLETDCSHFALLFDDDQPHGGVAFHSYGSGVHVEWSADFLSRYTVKHALRPKQPLTLEQEEKVYQVAVNCNRKKRYDWGAFLWWFWRGLLLKSRIKKLPAFNAWASPEKLLCVELLPPVLVALGLPLPDGDPAMMTPHSLYESTLATGFFETC